MKCPDLCKKQSPRLKRSPSGQTISLGATIVRKFADVAATNAPLARYLHKFCPRSRDEVEALDYLRKGAPFKGGRLAYRDLYSDVHEDIAEMKEEHSKEIKLAGGHWLQNPEHQDGVMAKGVKFGWWVADDTRALTKLLDLDPTTWGEPLWKPLGFSGTATAALKAILQGSSQ